MFGTSRRRVWIRETTEPWIVIDNFLQSAMNSRVCLRREHARNDYFLLVIGYVAWRGAVTRFDDAAG
jgi:hypothetical protein